MRAQALYPHLAALTIAVMAAPLVASAQTVPERMVFQGRLVRSDGTPETTPQNLRFSLYAQAQGGAPLWTETHMGVVLTNGHYAVELGTATPLSGIFTGEARWMAVAIASASDMGPRMPIGSAPYALHAADSARLGGMDANTFSRADHNHPDVSSSNPGFMTPSDKSRLDAVPTIFGNGLNATATGGGQRRLDVDFGGSGSSNNVARADHSHAPPSLQCTRRSASGSLTSGVTATCQGSEAVTGGGCEGVPQGGFPSGMQFTLSAMPVSNGYECRAIQVNGPPPSSTVTAHAICCRLQ